MGRRTTSVTLMFPSVTFSPLSFIVATVPAESTVIRCTHEERSIAQADDVAPVPVPGGMPISASSRRRRGWHVHLQQTIAANYPHFVLCR